MWLCKPFHQNPLNGFSLYYHFLVSGSKYCLYQQSMSSFLCESSLLIQIWWISHFLTSKLLTSTVLWIWHQKMVVSAKSIRWILAKWFANSIFEILMLSWIMCANFNKIGKILQEQNLTRFAVRKMYQILLDFGKVNSICIFWIELILNSYGLPECKGRLRPLRELYWIQYKSSYEFWNF